MKRTPLRRVTPLARVNRERQRRARERYWGPPGFLEYTHRQPCAICDCRPVEAAHVRSRGAGGTWVDIVPLCTHCHAAQHNWGIRTLEAAFEVSLVKLAEEHVCRWLQQEERAA